MVTVVTTHGYEYEEPDLTGKDDVVIKLSYADAYDIILDGLQCEASIEPLDPTTFAHNALNLLHLLIDASEEQESGSSGGDF